MRDEGGYVLTGSDLLMNGQLPINWPLDRSPYYLETNVRRFRRASAALSSTLLSPSRATQSWGAGRPMI